MTEIFALLLQVSLVVFMAGNLLDMGLRLQLGATLRGLRNLRFVAWTLIWGFVLGPALALALTKVIPLAAPYAMGLILIGMTPCAPFLPMVIDRARGDLAYTATFMVLTAIATVVFMPFAIPLLIDGLSVSAWRVAKPLLLLIFLPLLIGIAIHHSAPAFAGKLQRPVRALTAVATLATFVMLLVIYGKDLLGVPGSLALAAQLLFFSIVAGCSYQFAFGLDRAQRVVLSAGMSTRNLGAAVAPLLSIAEIDQRAIVMVVLSLPVTVIFAMLVAKLTRPERGSSHDHA
jgi:BASS family bile acid:Na+ symporter